MEGRLDVLMRSGALSARVATCTFVYDCTRGYMYLCV